MKIKVILSAVILCFLLVNTNSAQIDTTNEEIRIDTTLVSVPVIVSDRDGRYIQNLKATDFTVFQDGIKQEISFFAAEKEPLNIALLLDTSLSTHKVIDKIKKSAYEFIKQLEPDDKAVIITFDTEVTKQSPLTNDRKILKKSINNIYIGPGIGTVMRDAVLETTENILADVSGRKAIIILTDGKDYKSSVSEYILSKKLEESDGLIYSIFYKTEFDVRCSRYNRQSRRRENRRLRRRLERCKRLEKQIEESNKEGVEALNKMSDLTGGRFFNSKVGNLKEKFALITNELKNQYRLGYYPNELSEKSDIHKIRIEVKRKNVSIRARKFYRPN